MRVLIVVNAPQLGDLWARHLERMGADVDVVTGQDEAVATLCRKSKNLIILDLELQAGASMAVADFASYRQPDAKVICISDGRFFSDGSIFQHISNACAMVSPHLPVEDLAALAEHHVAH